MANWGDNPQKIQLARRDFSPHYSSRDPEGQEEPPTTEPTDPGPGEPGTYAEPLHEVPSAPGPHIDQIKSMNPGTWIELDPPAPDPVWGPPTGCTWGLYAFAYAPKLRGAFFYGEGIHGGWGGSNNTDFTEDDPRYWYGLDSYYFFDLNANRWICIHPGTPVEDLMDEFNAERWSIDPGKEQVVIDSPSPTLPTWLQGSIATAHLSVHVYNWMQYDTNRDRLIHFGRNADWLRGFRDSFFPRGSFVVQEPREFLDSQGYFDDTSNPPLGPVVYDPKQGKFFREPINFETYGSGFPAYTFLPEMDKVVRAGPSGSNRSPRFFDLATNEWGPTGQAEAPSLSGNDVAACHDSKRNRVYYGPASGLSDIDINDHFRYYDIDADEWVLPAPPKNGNEPPGRSWNTEAARLFYDVVSDKLLIFYLHHSPSRPQKVYIYDIDNNEWEPPVDAPSSMTNFPGNTHPAHVFYDGHLNVYWATRTNRDSGSVWRLYVYKHTELPGSPGEVVYNMELYNSDTGSATPDNSPMTMGLMFEPSAIPENRSPALSVNGQLIDYQIDRITRRHPDGSMSRAAATFYAPPVDPDSTIEVAVEVLDGGPPAGTVELAALEDADYSARITQDSTAYSASLNDAITAGDYRITRDGPVAKRIVAWRTLGSHADFWARFYATVFSDGTTQLMVQFINGGITNGVQHENVELLEVLQGTTAIWSFDRPDGTTPWTMNHHSSSYAVDPDGDALWSIDKPTLHARFAPDSKDYQVKARAWFKYRDIQPNPWLPDTGHFGRLFGQAVPTFFDGLWGMGRWFNDGSRDKWALSGGYPPTIGTGGDTATVAPLPNWTAKAIASQDPEWQRIDRIMAFVWHDTPCMYWNKDDNTLPALNTKVYSGLQEGQNDTSWHNATNTLSTPSFNDTSRWSEQGVGFLGSHIGTPAYWRAMEDGDEWFDDQVLTLANHHIGVQRTDQDPGSFTSAEPSRRRLTGLSGETLSVIHRGQIRTYANGMRNLECAYWVVPDDDPHRQYFIDLRNDNIKYREQMIEGHFQEGGSHESFRHLGLIWQHSHSNSLRMHMQDMGLVSTAFLFAHWHDQSAPLTMDHFIDRHMLAKGIDGCMGAGAAHTLCGSSGTGHSEWADTHLDDSQTVPFPAGENCQDGIIDRNGDWNLDFSEPHGTTNAMRFGVSASAAITQVAKDTGLSELHDRAKIVFDYLNHWESDSELTQDFPWGYDGFQHVDPKLMIRPLEDE